MPRPPLSPNPDRCPVCGSADLVPAERQESPSFEPPLAAVVGAGVLLLMALLGIALLASQVSLPLLVVAVAAGIAWWRYHPRRPPPRVDWVCCVECRHTFTGKPRA